MASERLERILADDYLAGLADLSMEDVRERRAECQQVEVALSYARRLVQGRLDIIGAELERRSRGDGPSDLAQLVDRLQQGEMLGDQARPAGYGRLPAFLVPGDAGEEFTAAVDDVADHSELGRLPELDDPEVQALAERLAAHERDLSRSRKAVFERIDALQAEIVRRYKTGSETVDTLLG